MYERSYWLDHVTSPSNVFNVVQNSDGTYTITRAGTVMQQGTAQDQDHFNNIEEAIVDAETAVNLLLNYARLNAWEVERGTKTLTNSAIYPFNNSQQSVALTLCKDSTDYIVIAEVESSVGNVGDIHVTDKLVNGFKLAYDGSASSAIINYTVIGGYLK